MLLIFIVFLIGKTFFQHGQKKGKNKGKLPKKMTPQ